MDFIEESDFERLTESEEPPPFVLDQELSYPILSYRPILSNGEEVLRFPPKNSDDVRHLIISGFVRKEFKEYKIKNSLGGPQRILERFTSFGGTVCFGDIELDEEGLLRLESNLRSQQQSGFIIYRKAPGTLYIVVTGDAYFDSVITANGPTSIRRVHIEVNGVLTVRKMEWILDQAMGGNVDLTISCGEFKMMGYVKMKSANPPRIRIQCKKNMVCHLDHENESHPVHSNILAFGSRKGGDIEIKIGGTLIVEQPAFFKRILSTVYSMFTESDLAARIRRWRHRMKLDRHSKYLCIDVGYARGSQVPAGYECGRIQINMPLKGNNRWRHFPRNNLMHYQIYDALKCIMCFDGDDFIAMDRVIESGRSSKRSWCLLSQRTIICAFIILVCSFVACLFVKS